MPRVPECLREFRRSRASCCSSFRRALDGHEGSASNTPPGVAHGPPTLPRRSGRAGGSPRGGGQGLPLYRGFATRDVPSPSTAPPPAGADTFWTRTRRWSNSVTTRHFRPADLRKAVPYLRIHVRKRSATQRGPFRVIGLTGGQGDHPTDHGMGNVVRRGSPGRFPHRGRGPLGNPRKPEDLSKLRLRSR